MRNKRSIFIHTSQNQSLRVRTQHSAHTAHTCRAARTSLTQTYIFVPSLSNSIYRCFHCRVIVVAPFMALTEKNGIQIDCIVVARDALRALCTNIFAFFIIKRTKKNACNSSSSSHILSSSSSCFPYL